MTKRLVLGSSEAQKFINIERNHDEYSELSDALAEAEEEIGYWTKERDRICAEMERIENGKTPASGFRAARGILKEVQP